MFFLFAILLVSTPFTSSAKEMYLPELHLLHAADLAVEASYVKEKGDFFWIKVSAVYKNGNHQIEQQDLVQVQKMRGRYTPGYFDFSAYQKARFYLKKQDGDAWALYGGTTQSARRIYNDTVRFNFEVSSVVLHVKTFNSSFQEFLKHYQLDSAGRYSTSLNEEQVAALKIFNPFVHAFEKNAMKMVLTLPEGPEDLEAVQKKPTCLEAGVPVVYNQNGTIAQLRAYLRDSVIQPTQAQELGIEGISFIRFTINTDGSQSDFEILRSLGPAFDEEVLRLVNQIPAWKPAEHRGSQVACQMILPVTFRIKDN